MINPFARGKNRIRNVLAGIEKQITTLQKGLNELDEDERAIEDKLEELANQRVANLRAQEQAIVLKNTLFQMLGREDE